MVLESMVSLIIFMLTAVFMSNFIITTSKYIITTNKISSDILKLRELEMFLNTEFDRYAFDFKVKSLNKIYYKKIVPIDETECEIKERELIVNNGTLRLEYDGGNYTNLIRNIDNFQIYKRNNLIFLNLELNGLNLVKIVSSMSYGI